MRLNPVAYGVDGIRQALYGGPAPASLAGSVEADLAVTAAFAVLALWAAARSCRRG